MKTRISILFSLLVSFAFAQQDTKAPLRQLTIEPAIGVRANPGTDFLLANVLQWNINRRLALASHSSYSINNITAREVNFVTTEYNYSLNQKFGLGWALYSKKSTHSFFLMAGAKYSSYKETMHHPDLEPASTAITSFTPDYGILYAWRKGVGNCFFSFRFYLPLYPYPIKGTDTNYADGNLNSVSLEFGVGIKLK